MCIAYYFVYSCDERSKRAGLVVQYHSLLSSRHVLSKYKDRVCSVIQKPVFFVLMLVLALALYLTSFPVLAYEAIAVTLCVLIVYICAHKEIKNSLCHFLGQYVFEIYILQRISMNLFNGYLDGWVYLSVCILVTLVLAYYFKKLEMVIDSYIF